MPAAPPAANRGTPENRGYGNYWGHGVTGGAQNMFKHSATAYLMGHFGDPGTHTRSLSSRQDDGSDTSHMKSMILLVDLTANTREGRLCWLRRQDSNLGSRIQSPLPYLLATPERKCARTQTKWLSSAPLVLLDSPAQGGFILSPFELWTRSSIPHGLSGG